VGVDFFDVALELEELFGVGIEPDDLLPVWRLNGNDCTAGDLHELVCKKCLAAGVSVPRGSWNRVRIALVKGLGVSPSEVKQDAWLRRDLQFY
jgi:hypothetical protein